MQKGLTPAVYQIYNYCQQLVIKFNQGTRDQEFLDTYIHDLRGIQLIDLLTEYLLEGLIRVQDKATESATLFFK